MGTIIIQSRTTNLQAPDLQGESGNKQTREGTATFLFRQRWAPPFYIFEHCVRYYAPGGVLNFELGTDVRPEVSATTL